MKFFYRFYVQEHITEEFSETATYNGLVELIQSQILPLTLFKKNIVWVNLLDFYLLTQPPFEYVKIKEYIAKKFYRISSKRKVYNGLFLWLSCINTSTKRSPSPLMTISHARHTIRNPEEHNLRGST